ncbi:MAG: response regulator [Oryzomonas sp.]|uniref:response regulator n=1 Tax=Oryzomonas sp. TaxID=2855186 RepID=UPI00284F3E82|nr:response regulator [Oryzomonas sp.]MDR3578954.1 response regulator [Oryzomonas sp.]
MNNTRAKILIVDDEPVNIRLLEGALKRDYEICSSQNGFEAIRDIKNQRPDLVLLDIMMPDMNGFDVCRVIRSDDAFSVIPVIFITAMDTLEGEVEGLEAGGIDYLSKPVNLDLLKLRVHNHLELKRRSDLIREQRDLLDSQKKELESALARIKRLEGVIPICMHCKSIRSDDESWHRLEEYISEHTDAFFSHGICPKCVAEFYPMMDLNDPD